MPIDRKKTRRAETKTVIRDILINSSKINPMGLSLLYILAFNSAKLLNSATVLSSGTGNCPTVFPIA
jgi:hypothetical protein